MHFFRLQSVVSLSFLCSPSPAPLLVVPRFFFSSKSCLIYSFDQPITIGLTLAGVCWSADVSLAHLFAPPSLLPSFYCCPLPLLKSLPPMSSLNFCPSFMFLLFVELIFQMDDDMNNSYECSNDAETAQFVSERLPSSNNVIRGQRDAYAVGKTIATGKYGAVYEVLRTRDGKLFAAKLEVCGVAMLNALNMDYVVLKSANKVKLGHFCTLVDRGMIQDHFKFLIMNMLGDNLYKMRLQFQQHRFSAPTSLRLALEMLESLEQLHTLGYVHRDVKPTNFALFHETGQSYRVILLDFGLCRHFKTATGGIKPPRDKTQFRGSSRYASLAAHRAMELSPKDDLESWFYVVVEFMTGDLPWSHFSASERDSVQKAKENARTLDGLVHLLKYCPRMEFKRIITYIDGLQYNSVPDYQYMRNLVTLAMRNNDIRPDEPYDWEQQEVAVNEETATTSSTQSKEERTRNGPLLNGGEQQQTNDNNNNNNNNNNHHHQSRQQNKSFTSNFAWR